MKAIDIIIAFSLGTAGVSSALAVATYDEGGPVHGPYKIYWSMGNRNFPLTYEPPEGESSSEPRIEYMMNVNQPNLTNAEVSIRASAIIGSNSVQRLQDVKITYELLLPEGSPKPPAVTKTLGRDTSPNVGATRGTLEHRFNVVFSETPETQEVSGFSKEDANATLAKDHTSLSGVGNWTIVVTFEPQDPQVNSFTYQIQTSAELRFYRHDLERKVPEINR